MFGSTAQIASLNLPIGSADEVKFSVVVAPDKVEEDDEGAGALKDCDASAKEEVTPKSFAALVIDSSKLAMNVLNRNAIVYLTEGLGYFRNESKYETAQKRYSLS